MDQSITDILKTIDDAIEKFQKGVPGIQKKIFEEIQLLTKGLAVKNGNILNNVENLKALLTLRNKLEKVIISPEYKDAVKVFIDSFNAVGALNIDYFKQFNKKFTPTQTLPIIKEVAIESTINDLVGRGMAASVIDPIHQILVQNVTTGGNYAKFQDTLRDHILTNESGDGNLVKYTKQITTDAIHQFSRQYHETIAQDLQFNWGQYVGSNLTTTREFCEFLTKKRWVHKSELPEVIKGHIDGHDCKLSKSTKLPLGMIPGTNPSNFSVLVGGYQCGHHYYLVPDSSVPADLVAKFKAL